MNRSDRRMQKKQRPSPLTALLQQAQLHHQAQRFPQAADCYQQILAADPEHAAALHGLGLLAYQTGRLAQAQELIARAVEHDDAGQAPYPFNLGIVLQRQGRLEEAAAAYQQALRLSPHYAEALSNLGNVRLEQGRTQEAEASYRRALAASPQSAEALNNLGVALKEQGRLEEAADCYRQALALKPGHQEAQCNLGIALMESGRLDEAIVCYQEVLKQNPGHAKAQTNLGFAYLWLERPEEALRWFRQAAATRQDHGRPVAFTALHRSRIKHEAEQMERLLARGLIPAGHAAGLKTWQELRRRAAAQPAGTLAVPVQREETAALAPSFNRILHYADSPVEPAGAVNPALDVAAIEARYHASRPEMTYIDDLLTPAALDSLRRFCLDSTIWKKDYANGYVGAFIGEGFSSPLFLQIAEELRRRFPGIFQGHRLMQAWAFKCDSEMKGLNLHADAAAVNVNFWITPDEANLDHEHGGLIVWDREAPKDWNFKEYNSSANEPKVRDFLRSSGARAIAVPYRRNRAIVFNSDLFHESDVIRFKDDYESRRINVTLLYGRRGG